MNVCVFGLWHLGTVTAACLAQAGHQVVGLDPQSDVIENLQQGTPPLFEPGLEALVKSELHAGNLTFTVEPATALANADVVWVTFDTPIDDDDQADSDYVIQQIASLFPYLDTVKLVLISSQLPVGTTARIEHAYRAQDTDGLTRFAYSPENLRLGKAIAVFTQPDRIVVGVRSETDRAIINLLLCNLTENIIWMGVESAEMTKHALNAFLATSVTFINEIAAVCEQVGADAGEVERGLKSETRIGPGAYLRPGGAFAGGTLARDVRFLQEMGVAYDLPLDLLNAITTSNYNHQDWAYRRLKALLGDLTGKKIAVLGLTYKPGTDTLRRSTAVALCRQLSAEQAIVQVHDPAVKTLPDDFADAMTLCPTIESTLAGAAAAVIATEWSDYKALSPDVFVRQMTMPLVLDANRFLGSALGNDVRLHYFMVGKPT